MNKWLFLRTKGVLQSWLNSKSNQKNVIWNKKEKKTALFFPPERWKEPFSGDRTRPERATLAGVVSLSNQINERAQVQNNNNINEGAQQSQQDLVQNNYGKKVLHQIVNVYIFLLSFQHQSLLLFCRFTGHMIFSNLDSCRVV